MEPGHIYTDLDQAVHAACCLCTLHSAGATVHCRITARNDEEYMITTEAIDYAGNGWRLDGDGWTECYTITSQRNQTTCRHCQDHIRPGAEVIWNGWTWHARCLPMLVLTETEERDKR